jgi:hypothetical protein
VLVSGRFGHHASVDGESAGDATGEYEVGEGAVVRVCVDAKDCGGEVNVE